MSETWEAAELRTLGIAGAGVMGQGIGMVAAQAGMEVVIYDPDPAALARAEAANESFLQKGLARGKISEETAAVLRMRLGYSSQREALVTDIVLEAAPERLDIKHELLRSIEALNEPETLLTSNTSTLPITQIAAALQHPERLVGMHFFNPAPLMPLVEVVAGAASHPAAVACVEGLARRMGKTPVRVADTPGFIVNRVARPFYLESLRILEEGGIEISTVDDLLRKAGFRMGPFELMDLIGLDTNLSVSETLYQQYYHEPRFRPSRLQRRYVEAGFLGRKTGQGFYSYPAE